MSTERPCEFELPLYPGSIPNESQHNRIMALMKRTGYTITQVNGQRIYGPPPDWTGPPPPKGCEVFVGKLPRGIYEDVIIPLFEQIGRIYQVRLLMDFSGTNRGYCFVHFTSPEDARMAIFKMDGYEICKGRFLGVVKSIDNCRLFVGGVPKTRTKEEITEEISRHVEGVIETILYNSVVNKRINRGFAFVEFESHRAAAVARRKFMTGKCLLWNQTEISVDWAEPEREVDARVMSKVRVLYMRNILLQTSEKRIQSAIEEVVESKMIERIKKMRDFAFIHFADRKSAEAAKIYWHKRLLDGSCVEVEWAKPIQNQNSPQTTYSSSLETAKYNKSSSFPDNPRYARHSVTSPRMCLPNSSATKVSSVPLPMESSPNICINASSQMSSVPLPDVLEPYNAAILQVPQKQTAMVSPQYTAAADVTPLTRITTQNNDAALQTLQELCQVWNWGLPSYQYRIRNSPNKTPLYECWIVIPNLPSSQKKFYISVQTSSVEDAIAKAANHVIMILNYGNYNLSV